MTQKRKRRRKKAGSYPLQLAAVVIVGVLGAWIAARVVEKALHPYWLGHAVGIKLAAARKELSQQNARCAELSQQVAWLRSPEGAETKARRAGYRLPGEQVYLIETPPTATEGRAKPEAR